MTEKKLKPLNVKKRFIVAEISKNWNIKEVNYPDTLMSQDFEKVLEVNLERGYRLHSYKLSQIMSSQDNMLETIIAVFERIEEEQS